MDVGAPFRLILFIRYPVYTTNSFIFWQEDFEDAKGVIRKSKNRQHNNNKNNNDLQNITHTTKVEEPTRGTNILDLIALKSPF